MELPLKILNLEELAPDYFKVKPNIIVDEVVEHKEIYPLPSATMIKVYTIYSSRYIIYDNGLIYNLKDGHYVEGSIKKGNKYKRINLMDDENKRHDHYVHRLVAMAFIPNPENKPTVNHKDKNRLNYHVSNLEWATSSEQALHRGGNTGVKRQVIQYI